MLMNYLFFDIECATCRGGKAKICEFAFVVTDESFNIIEKDEFIINPNSPFDWYALEKLLHFSKKDYKKGPTFDQVHGQIYNILNRENQLIFGQAVSNDIKFLWDESLRYKLPIIDVEFYDVGLIYKKLNDLEESRSLVRMMEELEIVLPNQLHRAVCDSICTMEVLKAITEKYKLSVPNLIKEGYAISSRFDFTEKQKKKKKKKVIIEIESKPKKKSE